MWSASVLLKHIFTFMLLADAFIQSDFYHYMGMVLCQLHICILERQSGKVSTCLVDIFITNLTDLSSSITWCSYNIYIASLTSVEHGCKQWSTEQLLHQPLQLHSRTTAYNYFHQLLLLFWWTLWCVACSAWPRSSSEDAYTVNKIFPSHSEQCVSIILTRTYTHTNPHWPVGVPQDSTLGLFHLYIMPGGPLKKMQYFSLFCRWNAKLIATALKIISQGRLKSP